MWHICSIAFVLFLNLNSGQCDKNYPDELLKPKPCSRKLNVITYQNEICVPDCSGGFTSNSEENCKSEFRDECPEFNEGSCEWYTLNFPGQGPREIPTCRLKYYARYTWMEIHYTHQYGPWMTDKSWTKTRSNCNALPIYDIVEVNRKIKKHEAFGYRDVNDWPRSVSDSSGERGLTWFLLKNPRPYPPELLDKIGNLCSQSNTDDLCANTVTKYLTDSGHTVGFNVSSDVTIDDGKDYASGDVKRTARCIDILGDDKVKRRACQVLYAHKATYMQKYHRYEKYQHCKITYLEVNVYSNTGKPKDVQLRFSYWPEENMADTEQVNCDRDFF